VEIQEYDLIENDTWWKWNVLSKNDNKKRMQKNKPKHNNDSTKRKQKISFK